MSIIKIYYDDIWNLHNSKKNKYIVVPTNMTVKKDGSNVCGRGIAREVVDIYPKFSLLYGKRLKNGIDIINGVTVFEKMKLITFPVKNSYKDNGNIKIIKKSLKILGIVAGVLCKENSEARIFMPVVGTGYAGLLYEEMLPLLFDFISKYDNVFLVIPPHKLYGEEKYRQALLPGITGKKDRRVSLSGCFGDLEI